MQRKEGKEGLSGQLLALYDVERSAAKGEIQVKVTLINRDKQSEGNIPISASDSLGCFHPRPLIQMNPSYPGQCWEPCKCKLYTVKRELLEKPGKLSEHFLKIYYVLLMSGFTASVNHQISRWAREKIGQKSNLKYDTLLIFLWFFFASISFYKNNFKT